MSRFDLSKEGLSTRERTCLLYPSVARWITNINNKGDCYRAVWGVVICKILVLDIAVEVIGPGGGIIFIPQYLVAGLTDPGKQYTDLIVDSTRIT